MKKFTYDHTLSVLDNWFNYKKLIYGNEKQKNIKYIFNNGQALIITKEGLERRFIRVAHNPAFGKFLTLKSVEGNTITY